MLLILPFEETAGKRKVAIIIFARVWETSLINIFKAIAFKATKVSNGILQMKAELFIMAKNRAESFIFKQVEMYV